jgi:hypothetical protein
LYGFFGQLEITQPTNEGGEQLAVFLAVDAFESCLDKEKANREGAKNAKLIF